MAAISVGICRVCVYLLLSVASGVGRSIPTTRSHGQQTV
jgi:hypothetical protein